MKKEIDCRVIMSITLCYFIALFFVKNIDKMIYLYLILFFYFFLIKLDIKKFFKVYKYSIWINFYVIIVNYFFREIRGVNLIYEVLRVNAFISIFIAMGINIEIKDFEKIFNIKGVGTILALAIRNIYFLKENIEKIIISQKSRGIDIKLMSPLEKIKTIKGMIIPLIVIGLKNSINTAKIMEVRGFDPSKKRSSIKLYKIDKKDWFILGLNLILILFLLKI